MTEDPGALILPTLTQFEAIRHFEESGEEYWTARELMKLLGYTKWQNFERVIEEAKAVCAREGKEEVERIFTAISKNSPGALARGRKGTDYRLTRSAKNGQNHFRELNILRSNHWIGYSSHPFRTI